MYLNITQCDVRGLLGQKKNANLFREINRRSKSQTRIIRKSFEYTNNIRMTSTLARKPPSDESRWISLYPSYINAKKTQREGRRIPKQKAVDTPTWQEMLDILQNAGLNVRSEKKMYPRDQNRDYQFQGRIRVQLKDDEGKLCNENYPTRESLMFYLADTIPKLKTRQQRSGPTVQAEASQQPQKAAGAGPGKKKKR